MSLSVICEILGLFIDTFTAGELHSLCNWLPAAKDMVRKMFEKIRFRNPFESQHAKESKTLLKTSRQPFTMSLWQKFSWKMSL